MIDTGFSSAEQLGLHPGRLEQAKRLLEGWTASGEVPAISICIGRREGTVSPWAIGREDESDGSASVDPGTTFLVASLTKPLTALATVMLIERGQLILDDLVADYLPEFAQVGKGDVRVRHLLTHTSGLPDMLPDNAGLRASHSSPSRFFEEVCKTPLLFPSGTQVRYQSMGFLVLSELIQRVSGRSLASFLAGEVFAPLGMLKTWLGVEKDRLEAHARTRIPPEAEATDWHWNSPYWLGFGAAWGGLVTTAADYARILRMMILGGELDGVRIVSPASVASMTENQLRGLPDLAEGCCERTPWGLGWRLRWPGRSAFFGDLLGPRMYGHWGSTGTLAWVDPDRDAFAVVLTTLPQDPDGPYLTRAANALAATFA